MAQQPPIMTDIQSPAGLTLFGWGSADVGQLGLGGIEQHQVTVPTEIKLFQGRDLQAVACSQDHTLFAVDGVYSCGGDDHGKLGQRKSHKRPGKLCTNPSVELGVAHFRFSTKLFLK